MRLVKRQKWMEFQSTPPARGATKEFDALAALVSISIHAPREGGDGGAAAPPKRVEKFQSTPPARGATFSSKCVTAI